ncbi:YigZ family protein [Campylobacter hepaticus]|nr:YigZ family protein [Campylobacter hepaticus]
MQTVNQIFQATIEVKKSNFLSFLCPFIEFKNLFQDLKNKHPKAVHFVYAYRTLNELNQIIEDKSDDKEPKGTAGMPTLNVLRKHNLINVGLITVRYFGGIKLGTGGLARAYNEAANTLIRNSILFTFKFEKNISIMIDLKILNRFEHFLKINLFNFTRDFKNEKAILHIKLNEKEKFEIFCQNFTPYEIERI